MYQDLLLATDGSEGADQATEHAIELASQLDATLHILSVSEDGPHSSDKRDKMRADPEDESAQAVDEAEQAVSRSGLESTTIVRHGVAQEEIVDVAETEPIDMIVMGTHGRTGLDHLIVGSVAEEVVRNAPVPVVTVRDRA
ncbi:universal stress protein [Natronorubrum bangense]|uniref:UspA domain-containing protein n=2 Tax=Natronorubrum bangense TaxID=61858 RepID=L9W5K2_9EURY|nr:universal stress protein [Natronorubrum bangense]ELY44750.1 UspA domain-containing protein [Natronorubrum bangense JCM 10635]QCC56797.1 universal stress protein [Natronorubrum bangense]